jgi:site-specific recombinase XerD
MNNNYSLGESFEYFRSQSNLSPSSLDTYGYAVQHFFHFLENSKSAEPLSISGPNAAEKPLALLGSETQDVNLLAWFVNYIGKEARPDRSRSRNKQSKDSVLEASTVRLYGQAVITWFSFLADELLLPRAFSSKAAIARAQRRTRTYVPYSEARDSAPDPPEGIETLIYAFDSPSIDASLPLKEQQRLHLVNQRNRALVYALADSGARISEILRLSADDIRRARVNRQGIWSVEVRGKGRGRHGRMVTLRFTAPTLSAMRDYISLRNDPSDTTLFVSHARTRPKYHGTPLSPNAAWRIIRKAADDLGLPPIHPHDFRHWRATQMLREGVPIDQVQRYLNHRSLRTTQLYAKTAERQVDEAGARTSPFTPFASSESR